MTPPTPTPEQIVTNRAEAKANGYYLLCGGRYTWQLEREWHSILSIVPEDFAEAWALEGIDVEELATQVNADNQEAYIEAMD